MKGSSWQDVQRLLFWSNVLQGTPGYSYGTEGIWQFNTEEEPFGASPTGETWGNVPWSVAMDYQGSAQLGRGAEWLRGLPWWKITPAPNRVSHPASPEDIYHYAKMGRVYQPGLTGGRFFIRLKSLRLPAKKQHWKVKCVARACGLRAAVGV